MPPRPLLLGIVALSAALRFTLLGRHSLWFDEAWVARVIRLSWHDLPATLRTWDNHPPLFYILMKAWSSIAGTREAALRMPSALFSCLTVPLTYTLMRRFSTAWASLLGAFFVALSPLEIMTGQEARMYPLLGAAVLASSLALLVNLERAGWTWSWWALYVALSIVIVYTHYLGFLVLVAQGLWVHLYERPRLRMWAAGMALVGLAYLPWISSFWHQVAITTATSQGGGPVLVTALLGLFAFGGSLFGMPDYFFTAGALGPGTQLLVLLPFLAVVAWGVKSFRSDTRDLSFIGLPLAIVIGVPLAISVRHPLFIPRWFSFLYPFYAILAARGVDALAHELPGVRTRLTALLATGLVLFSLPVLDQYYLHPESRPYNWRGAALLVKSGVKNEDLVLFISPEARIAFTYYFADPPKSQTIPTEEIDPGPPEHFTPAEAGGLAAQYPRVWFVVTPPFDRTKGVELRTALGSMFRVAERHDFGGVWVYVLDAKAARHPAQIFLNKLH